MIPSCALLATRSSGSGGGGGGGGGSVSISDLTVLGTGTSSATAYYQLSNDGNIYYSNEIGTHSWLVSGSAGDFEVRATVTSGSLTSGTTGSWLSLGSAVTWSLVQTGVGGTSAVLLIQIRDASSLSVLDSANITLDAEVNS